MESEAHRRGPLEPSSFEAWSRTCAEFTAAIAAGPGTVALVGPEGSGKTYTMTAFLLSNPDAKARLRQPGASVGADVLIDLVDGAGTAGAAPGGEPAFDGVRAISVRPEGLGALLDAYPDARVCRVHPMSPADVRAMVETRKTQAMLPDGAFTLKALKALERLSGGNPRRLERLLGRAGGIASAGNATRISGEHVVQAGREIAGQDDRSAALPAQPPGPPASGGARSTSLAPGTADPGTPAGALSRPGQIAARAGQPAEEFPVRPAPASVSGPVLSSTPAAAGAAPPEPVPAADPIPALWAWDVLSASRTPEELARAEAASRPRARNLRQTSAISIMALAALAVVVPSQDLAGLRRLSWDAGSRAVRYVSGSDATRTFPIGDAARVGNEAEAARLLALGLVLVLMGQPENAREMFMLAAVLGQMDALDSLDGTAGRGGDAD